MKAVLPYALLTAWCVFVIGPGMLAWAGLFGHIDANTPIPSALNITWLVGYLLQLGVFLWVMSIVGKPKVVWWLLASSLPLAIDWTLPVSSLFMLIWFPVVFTLAGRIAVAIRRLQRIRWHGIEATGVVLEVFKPWMNVVVNGIYIKRKVRLRIERADGVPPYESTWNGLFMIGAIPSTGGQIPLLVDPASPHRFEYHDEGSHLPRVMPRHGRSLDGGRIADELAKLASLHDRGAITDAEFDAAKKKLLH
jgi:hypothetical protein